MSENDPVKSQAPSWFTVTTHRLSAATLGTGTSIVLCYLGQMITGHEVPGPVGAALGGMFTFVISWALPDAWEADE